MDQPPDIPGFTSAARAVSRVLANATTGLRSQAPEAITTAVAERSEEILRTSESDPAWGRDNQMSGGLLDRLALTPERIEAVANLVREVEVLSDPVGEVIRGTRNELGPRIVQLCVPVGVIGMIYEVRPNVTVDAAVLVLKASSAVILRGGSAAQESNKAIIGVIHETLVSLGLPAGFVQGVGSFGRTGVTAMMKARGGTDVLAPRGGASPIHTVVENSIAPTIETGIGNCHVYADSSVDLEAVEKIIMNMKIQRIGMCNVVETLLVHIDKTEAFYSNALRQLAAMGVTPHLDEHAMSITSASDAIPVKYLKPVVEDD